MLLEEGIARLDPFVPVCQRVDVAALLHDATTARAALLELGPDRMSEYDLGRAPKVRLIGR